MFIYFLIYIVYWFIYWFIYFSICVCVVFLLYPYVCAYVSICVFVNVKIITFGIYIYIYIVCLSGTTWLVLLCVWKAATSVLCIVCKVCPCLRPARDTTVSSYNSRLQTLQTSPQAGVANSMSLHMGGHRVTPLEFVVGFAKTSSEAPSVYFRFLSCFTIQIHSSNIQAMIWTLNPVSHSSSQLSMPNARAPKATRNADQATHQACVSR